MTREQELIEELIRTSTNPRITAKAMKWREELRLPMSVILDKVPGKSIQEKIDKIGVPRQTWYSWRAGDCRPNMQSAKKLARLTGYSVKEIKGWE